MKSTLAVIIAFLLFTGPAKASEELAIYQAGLTQLEASRYLAAAQEWTAVRQRLLRRDSSAAARQQAALAEILATIAYEMEGSNAAYLSWSKAVGLFLEAGTTWDDFRGGLAARLQAIEDERARYQGRGWEPEMTYDDLLLLDLQAVTDVARYGGPRPGLKEVGGNVAAPRGSLFGGGDSDTVNNDPPRLERLRPSTPPQAEPQPSKVGSRRGLRDPARLLKQDKTSQAPSGKDLIYARPSDVESYYRALSQDAGIKPIKREALDETAVEPPPTVTPPSTGSGSLFGN